MKKWTPYADCILKNGKIYTVDTTIENIKSGNYDFPIIENGYVAMKDGKIIGVGAGMDDSLVGDKTVVVDINKKTVIPGLMDSHMHASIAGAVMKDIDCSRCTCLEDMLKLIKERVAIEPAGTWIRALAFNELAWNDHKIPDVKVLDEVTEDHPFLAMRLCGHVNVANSKAMELAGVTKDTPQPEGGTIDHYEDGTPNGWFHERNAMCLIEKCVPKTTKEEMIKNLEIFGKYMNSVGLTSVIDCNLDFEQTRAYSRAYQEGRLSYRANVTFFMSKESGDTQYHLKRLDEMMAVTGFGDEMLKFNGVKILLDGVPAAGTAYMRKNYKHMPQTRGFTTFSQEEMNEICKAAAVHNWQMAVHAIGDAAMDVTLNAYQEASKVADISQNRNYIIHAVFPREDMLPVMKKLEVAVTVQPTIMGLMGEEAVLDDVDAALNQPAGLYFKEGIICGGGTDCPVVSCNPFLGMSKAINRLALDGKVHGPENCVTPAQALLMWTMNSAYISHDEEKLGSITVGKLADVVVIDTPILEVNTEEIEQTKVLQTYLGGKLVYEA